MRDFRGFLRDGQARGLAKFVVMSPECINSAQYITSYSIKDKEGKNLRFPEGIFGLFLIFGRDKTENFGKIEACKGRGSESPVPGSINKGKSKKQAKIVSKYVIISIQYAINLIFFQTLRTSDRITDQGTQKRGHHSVQSCCQKWWESPPLLGDFHWFLR